MTSASDVEKAERVGRARAWLFALQGALFIGWQGLFFLGRSEAGADTADEFSLVLWLAWVVLLLVLLATGGGLLRGSRVRRLLNDELTRLNRLHACAAGFWAAAGASILLFIVNLVQPLSGREAIHIVVSAAIGAALLTFAARERRSADTG
jgi:hypothetical protein